MNRTQKLLDWFTGRVCLITSLVLWAAGLSLMLFLFAASLYFVFKVGALVFGPIGGIVGLIVMLSFVYQDISTDAGWNAKKS